MGIDLILDDLAEHGFTIVPQFLDSNEVQILASAMQERRDLFHKAGIGRKEGHIVQEQIRGDNICWIDANDPIAARALSQLDELKQSLNAALYLGLDELECHFAAYPVGSFYARHLDQHRGEDSRVVTVVLYLNPEWTEQDGGELRLYLDEHRHLDILPQGGKLVIFLSNRFEHEVLISQRERLSLTGWFRRRSM
ncbi:2OG-Fe(II) oxygenase [Iodobacter sp. HSC-16F04]|uniref:2OG-Fe(II) oxygenase n=1 Tax=Iodobacter violaceini TaxID=3044271 RepID=A0ABX0L120_9NEIS|nr:2OG-Fe(II) oxygenase [Iodobacter violacea]NHQ87994.1 2OG-Fe(II) oxygenase [Iodobacter violacea]